MKPSIQLRIGQHLTLTPQLQQAIRLLQLSSLELKQLIQDALDSNIMLAEDELEQNDDRWDQFKPVKKNDYLEQFKAPYTLRDHLHQQKDLYFKNEQDRMIATAIIDNLDEDGYLRVDLNEIQTILPDLEKEDVEAVLKGVQSFDPAGIAARDLAECLQLQLQAMPKNPIQQMALHLVQNQFERFQKRRLDLLDGPKDELQLAIRLIQSLDPKPGYQIQPPPTDYIAPDVFIEKKGSHWQIRLNTDLIPRIKINPDYIQLNQTENSVLLKAHLQEARWLIKSLNSRNQTLLKVAEQIVQAQIDFFEQGEESMKPLVLKDIAQSIDMHESTVSRICHNKYMLTPRGLFEFKYFFSNQINDKETSSTAIRAKIRKFILAEDPKKPLSDNKIAHLLGDEGIKIARRTVAKYREMMAIPPSSERKKLV